MIDPQELEAAAKDIMQRTGFTRCRVNFGVSLVGGDAKQEFYVSVGWSGEHGAAYTAAETLGVAVEKVIALVAHNKRTDIEKARELLRSLESQAA